MTTTNYYLKDGKLFEIDRIPPTDHPVCECAICRDYKSKWDAFHTYLSNLQPIPHTFSGHSRVVPEGEIEWRYKITTTKGWKECTEETYNILPDVQRRRVATPKITGGPELPNLSASTANLSQIKDKDEWLKDVRGESTGYTSTSGEEVGQTFEEYENGDFIHRPPLGLLPKWRHDELRLQEIQEAIDRYSADGKDIPKEWANEMAILISPPPPSPQKGEKELTMIDLPRPTGEFILAQKDISYMEFPDGAYWHYKDVITLLHRYAPHQPPAAQPDQEAADEVAAVNYVTQKHNKQGGDNWYEEDEAEKQSFLAGCNHVRGQQPVDAVAFAEWIIENGYKSPGGSVWYNIYEEKETLINSQKLYALFTARHPNPKPGSHDTEGKEGAGC